MIKYPSQFIKNFYQLCDNNLHKKYILNEIYIFLKNIIMFLEYIIMQLE